jgi:N-acyl-D-amino-acid deacylase
MFDFLIRGGTLVDGTGARSRRADVAVKDGWIVAVEPNVTGDAREVVDADGLHVLPGFIDVHTHYDGQVTWDDAMLPSAAHGVTTVVLGNCGVGFAPVHRGAEEWLISLMEGVEDIPGTALHEGIRWEWEAFPEYMDALAKRRYAVDVAAQVPHGALRAYVMGERGAADEPATGDDVATMARLVGEAVAAGAVGFTSSRTAIHQARDGRPVPGTTAALDEVLAIGAAMKAAGGAVFELVPSGRGLPGVDDPWTMSQELDLVRRFATRTGQPVTFSVGQTAQAPQIFDQVLEAAGQQFQSLPVYLQFSGRSGGVLSGLQGSHALQRRPTMAALVDVPLDERVARLQRPEVKAAVLTEADLPPRGAAFTDRFDEFLRKQFGVTHLLGEPPDYEPHPRTSIASVAAAERRTELDVLYDLLIDRGGRSILITLTTNYATGDLRTVEQMLRLPNTVLGLGDGGAHVRYICDASIPTFMLTHWTRDRNRGPKVPIEQVVAKQTSTPAQLYGFGDRGSVEVGKRADLNVIDLAGLGLGTPRLVQDLPGGAQRMLQDATGYRLTLVSGVATRRNDTDTGARPGRLVRGRRAD